MLTDEERRYILNEFLADIRGIADIDYQKRIWILGEGPECDDFGETRCRFFGTASAILEEYKKFHITDVQYRLTLKFSEEFEAFCRGPSLEYYLPELFINTPEWAKITERAKEVLKAFNYTKK
jgi:hypothetical protein